MEKNYDSIGLSNSIDKGNNSKDSNTIVEKNQGRKTCPNCGANLAESVSFCSECGYSFKQAAESMSPPVNDTITITKSGVKRVGLIAGIAVLVIALLIVGITIFQGSIYNKNYNEVVELIEINYAACNLCAYTTHEVWYNTIWQETDTLTNAFTLKSNYVDQFKTYTSGIPSYAFNDDFNTSLNTWFVSIDFQAYCSVIDEKDAAIDALMKKLSNPSKRNQSAYSALLDLYYAYERMYELAINPTGSLTSFTDEFKSASQAYTTAEKSVSMYLK